MQWQRKKDARRLIDHREAIYSQLFSSKTNALQMYRYVMVYRMIDGILSGSEASENSYSRRMFFRHGRQFIANFVGSQCANALQAADHSISESDRTAISILTNTISELICEASRNLRFNKGYLAIFRNMTDAQPLADEVLRLLKEERIQSGEDDLTANEEGPPNVE